MHWIYTLFFFLLCTSQAISLESSSNKTGTCSNPSQVVFLAPPPGFSPKFEVAGCFCEYEGHVLFLLRNEEKPQGSTWCVPGGKLNVGESAESAVIREVKEETSAELDPDKLRYCRSVYVRFPDTEFILHLFRFDFIQPPPELTLALEEHTDYLWVTYEGVLQLPLIPGGKDCFRIAFSDKVEALFE